LTFCDLPAADQTTIKPTISPSPKYHKIIMKKFINNFIIRKPYPNNQSAAHLFHRPQPYHTFQDLHSTSAMLNLTRRHADVKKIQIGMQRMNAKNNDGNGRWLQERNQPAPHGIPTKDPITKGS
jgi:hypothetical protein